MSPCMLGALGLQVECKRICADCRKQIGRMFTKTCTHGTVRMISVGSLPCSGGRGRQPELWPHHSGLEWWCPDQGAGAAAWSSWGGSCWVCTAPQILVIFHSFSMISFWNPGHLDVGTPSFHVRAHSTGWVVAFRVLSRVTTWPCSFLVCSTLGSQSSTIQPWWWTCWHFCKFAAKVQYVLTCPSAGGRPSRHWISCFLPKWRSWARLAAMSGKVASAQCMSYAVWSIVVRIQFWSRIDLPMPTPTRGQNMTAWGHGQAMVVKVPRADGPMTVMQNRQVLGSRLLLVCLAWRVRVSGLKIRAACVSKAEFTP